MTSEQKARTEQDWGKLAKEPVIVEMVGGEIYGYGSEIGMLRLEHEMRCGRAFYSANLGTWTYSSSRKA